MKTVLQSPVRPAITAEAVSSIGIGRRGNGAKSHAVTGGGGKEMVTSPMLNPERFPSDPYPAEIEFARCLREGRRCKIGTGELPDPTSGDESKIVRGEVIRFFAYGGDGGMAFPVRGPSISLEGAWIKGGLKLAHANVRHALFLKNSHFSDSVDFSQMTCPSVDMAGSHLAMGLKGTGLATSRGVSLCCGFSADQEVNLEGARIGGDLDCRGGNFNKGDEKDALRADGAHVGGCVYLSEGFRAEGEVRLLAAHIGIDLDCHGGTKFENPNPDEDALSFDRANVGSNVLLRKGFCAEGTVRLRGAHIRGNLDCAGGCFHRPNFQKRGSLDKKHALDAERVKTGGHVYLNQDDDHGGISPFSALGSVRLATADIGGNLNCKGGKFNNPEPEGKAISASGLKTRGAVFLSDGFSAEGEVQLHVARIGGNFVCAQHSKPDAKNPPEASEIQESDRAKSVINLESANASAVHDDTNSGERFHFRLDGFTYDRFFKAPTDAPTRLKWLRSRPASTPFSPQPYEQAAQVLFGMGKNGEAREILLEKEKDSDKHTDECGKRQHWWQKPLRWLWGALSGYGYQPERTFFCSLFVIAVGVAVFWFADSHDRIAPHQATILASAKYQEALTLRMDATPKTAVRGAFPEYPEFNPLVFSFDVFIPFFALHQEPFWYPDAGRGNFFEWLAHWRAALIVAVGVLVSVLLFFVALTGLCLCLPQAAGKKWGKIMDWVGLIVAVVMVAAVLSSPNCWWLVTLWYWFEIGAGWVLTSLFLLSVTGLLRPRQSGEKG